MKSLRRTTGFTLVELSLSLAFIGILSLTTVLIINNTVLAYRRGLTLNQINTVGMELVDDIRTTVQNSPAQKCSDDPTDSACLYFIKKDGEQPSFGGFCSGRYSYVWQSGYNASSPFRLLKIEDYGRQICADYSSGSLDISGLSGEELIPTNSGLALYNLTVSAPALSNADNSAYYSISFILGTTSGGPSVLATGDYCKPPEDANSSFNYCAINKFNFAAQAGGYNAT